MRRYSFWEKAGALFVSCILPWLLLGLEAILKVLAPSVLE